MKPGDLVVIVPAQPTEVKVSQARAQPGPSYSRSTGLKLKASWNEEMMREAAVREYVAACPHKGKYAVVVSVDVGNYALLAVEGELVHMHICNLQVPLKLEITL